MPPSLRAQCTDVVDGDTVTLFVDQGQRWYSHQRYRLITIDTYEMNDVDPAKRDLAQQAKRCMAQWCSVSPVKGIVNLEFWPLRVVTHKSDSFGRWLVDLYFTDDAGVEHHANAELLAAGLAVPFKR